MSEPAQQPETIMIDTLDGFVRALHAWHQNKIQLLRHMKTIPAGTEVTRNNGEPRILSGDLLEGMILGLDVALEELGELPFEAEVTFTEEQPVISSSEAKLH